MYLNVHQATQDLIMFLNKQQALPSQTLPWYFNVLQNHSYENQYLFYENALM